MARLLRRMGASSPAGVAGERVARTGLAVPESGFFGKEFTVEDLGKLGRGVQAAYKGASDVWSGVVDPVYKKVQDVQRQKEIREARIEAANVALARDEAIAEAEGFAEGVGAEAAGSALAPERMMPGPLERPQLRMDPSLATFPRQVVTQGGTLPEPRLGTLPETRLERMDADLQKRAVLAKLTGEAPSGVPPLGAPHVYPPAAPAPPAIPPSMRPGPPRGVSPTGATVTPLQVQTAAAPARAVQAPQAAPAQTAAPTRQLLSDDRALLSDPANRAFVREVMRQAKNSGMPMEVDQAIDLLKLEIAKRDVPARRVVDTQYDEVLEMEPSEAARTTDLTGMFRVAENSTLADWPRIERVAREVIRKQPRGFIELVDMKGQLKEIYDRIPKPVGTKGVEFDLKGPADRAKSAAQSRKALRRTGRGKGRGRRSKLDQYLTTTEVLDPLTGIPVYQWHVMPEFEEGADKALDGGLLNQVRAEANKRNKKEGVRPSRTELSKQETRERLELVDDRKLKKAQSMVKSLQKSIKKLDPQLSKKEFRSKGAKEGDNFYRAAKVRHDRKEAERTAKVATKIEKLEKAQRGHAATVTSFINIVEE